MEQRSVLKTWHSYSIRSTLFSILNKVDQRNMTSLVADLLSAVCLPFPQQGKGHGAPQWEMCICNTSAHYHEICALLGNHAACSRTSLTAFHDNLSVPSSRVKALMLVPISLYRNLGKEFPPHAVFFPGDSRSHLLRGRSLISCITMTNAEPQTD